MPRKSEQTTSKSRADDRLVKASNIVGLAEIAERTKSTPHAVWNWTKRYEGDHPFPTPIATASGRPVYDWAEVEDWNKNWVRSKGGWHTHQSQREQPKKTTSRRQYMEGDDDGTRPSRAKKAPARKPASKSTGGATVTPIRRARRSRART